jgi:hypothetical protein
VCPSTSPEDGNGSSFRNILFFECRVMDKVQKLSTHEQCLNFAIIFVTQGIKYGRCDEVSIRYKFMEKSPSWEAGQALSRISPLNMESKYSLHHS